MNPIDDQMARLFRAASHRPTELAEIPYGFEMRAVAAWRGAAVADVAFWDMSLLMRGLVVAIVLMGISFWPVLNRTSDPFTEYVQLADSSLPSDVAP